MSHDTIPDLSGEPCALPERCRLLKGAAALAGTSRVTMRAAHAANAAPVVETTCGKLRGGRHGASISFMGIPYAASTIFGRSGHHSPERLRQMVCSLEMYRGVIPFSSSFIKKNCFPYRLKSACPCQCVDLDTVERIQIVQPQSAH